MHRGLWTNPRLGVDGRRVCELPTAWSPTSRCLPPIHLCFSPAPPSSAAIRFQQCPQPLRKLRRVRDEESAGIKWGQGASFESQLPAKYPGPGAADGFTCHLDKDHSADPEQHPPPTHYRRFV